MPLMRELQLTTEPLSYDPHGLPSFFVAQDKGLIESQNNHLIKEALADGYTGTVARKLFSIVASEVKKHGGDVMEIGGGRGDFYEFIKNDVQSYLNLEPGTPTLSGRAINRLADPKFMTLRASAEFVPLPNESFDVILSIASFDHIPDYRKALAEVSRLLKPAGLFILTLNNRRSWWKSLLANTEYLKRREAEIAKEHYFQWSFQDCKHALSQHFQIVSIYTTTYIPFVPRIGKYLLPIADFTGHAFQRYGANIIAVCQKGSQ